MAFLAAVLPVLYDVNRLVPTCVWLCLMVSTLPVRAADCWVQKAVRNGTRVNVVLSKPKGDPPGVAVPATIIRAGGSRISINELLFTSTNPVKTIVVNPRTYVVLHLGDRLSVAGMDDGCTVTVVRVSGKMQLRIEGGFPHVPGNPGANRSYDYLLPVETEK